MNRLAYVFLALAAACGGDDGGSNTGIDAPGGGKQDAPVTTQVDAPSNIPATVTISGVVNDIGIGGKTPISGATITAFQRAGDVMIATTTSGADGTFSISAPTNGSPVDAYLVSKSSNHVDTYLYPPYVLSKDFSNIPVYMLSSGNLGTATSLMGEDYDKTKGWIGAVITDAAQNPVTGATLTSTPAGAIHYNDPSNGLPGNSNKAKATASDGTAYDVNVAVGDVTVSATATGATFQSHVVKARAGVVTLTLVTP